MDNTYFCETLSHLLGLPVRLYRNNLLLCQCSNVEFSPDPVSLVIDSALAEGDAVQFFESNLLFFGSIRYEKANIVIVIGPSFTIRPGSDHVHALTHTLGIAHERLKEFSFYLQNIPTYPVESFLQVLCFIHYFLNKKKLSISELVSQGILPASEQDVHLPNSEADEPARETIHNTYQMEQEMLSYITAGQPGALRAMFSGPPTGSVGRIAHDELRQRKNTFICAATLASRAAIRGGLSHETAFALSDSYIQKAELLGDYASLAKLNMTMLTDFATRVETLSTGGGCSQHVTEAIRYINKNINRKLTLEQIAGAVGISRTHLCAIFKKETGKTLISYFTERKITEAKRLLSTTDMPLGAIGEYLGYSSQSHFQKVFRDFAGETPLAFRIRCS
ncbi:MAG TPA: helix-turn-helix domain-containing protein [Eubacteriales bacterium]|nr:helix-turn-helix domain-containing protein [Eubacteriales bacterium]